VRIAAKKSSSSHLIVEFVPWTVAIMGNRSNALQPLQGGGDNAATTTPSRHP
jgi:hypothetical protein